MKRSIVMTVCQRPYYLKPVLDGWEKVRGVRDWPFIFMVEPTPTRDAMLRIIEEFDHPNKIVIQNPVRLGVLSNPHAGLNNAFYMYDSDFVVLAEEDLLPSTNALEYFEFGSNQCRGMPSVLAVCAQGEGDQPDQLEFKASFKVWLWGTWKDRWENLLSDTWDHNYSSGDQMTSGWDWNIELRIIPQYHLMCLFPKASLVDNLGKWGGAHAIADEYDATRPIGFVQEIDPISFELNTDG